MSYAKTTKVPIARSQAEIQKILSKHGATAFAFAETKGKAMVQFEMAGKRIKFLLPTYVYATGSNYSFPEQVIAQKNRARWRALVLAIKAKLECVEAEITTLEQEFMAHIVLPNGNTVGDVVLPEIESSYKAKEMPLLLGMR